MRNLLKKLAVPLQAFSALGICLGMFWMIFVVANFNPTPPTALDLQARSTEEDLSFASMNSTAAALAFEMVSDVMPSPIVMPVTGNSTPTLLPSPTIAVTLRVVSTTTETGTPFSLFSVFFNPTATRKPRTDPPTLTFTATPLPTKTPSRLPTRTPTVTKTYTPLPVPTTPVPTTPVPTTPVPTTPVPTTPVPTTPVVPTETETTEPPTTQPASTSETPEPIQQTPEAVQTGTEQARAP